MRCLRQGNVTQRKTKVILSRAYKKPTLEIKWWDWSDEKIKKNKNPSQLI